MLDEALLVKKWFFGDYFPIKSAADIEISVINLKSQSYVKSIFNFYEIENGSYFYKGFLLKL